ncbi:RnfABCDGE type electron transport complex subunit D [Actinophytocola gossypii]|uniref:RnfABCDGE type electron transport complex subunit D n=1 Tax=Actinophytocola gossypii TaxID=2812003 RepID=A0ABT2J7C1_9PSEU|nr:RnfABCDGE type electron transport complex subunit D [Actinophytocola gossypii]MCT2583752.1 RnfABCDGE type electron transport complex subunit D [Actinophytocola gossypii]
MAESTEPKAPPRHNPKVIIALRRFAISITVFNIVGYLFLGFEQPWIWPFVALATAYTTELVLEWVGSRAERRDPRYAGNGARGLMEFLFPAHITGLALNMLTYVNDRIWVMMLGVFIAVSAKWVLRAPVKGKLRHYMNPSNFGIAMILVLFPSWASIAPPYHFTEKVDHWVGWLIVAVIIVSGTMLNAKLTGRMWLIFGWLSFFVLQAVVRGLLFGVSIPAALGMMTGVAFILYTNYMVTDPGTTPSKPGAQFLFGAGVAVAYGFFMVAHIAYGLFFATAAVCLIRGVFLWSLHFVEKAKAQQRPSAEVTTLPTGGTPAGRSEVRAA